MSATVYRSRVSLVQALLLAALFLAPGAVFAQSSHHRNRANDLSVRQPDPDSKTFLVPWILLPSGPFSPTRANSIDDRSAPLGLATISSAHRAGARPATARHGSGGAQSTDNWIGGKGNWSVSTNWSAGLPVSTSDVTITNLGSAVTEDISATISTLTVGSGDSLVTNNNIDLTIDGATITNSGAMVLNSIGNTTELVIGGTTTTLSGGGTLALSNSTANFILGNGTSTLVNANNTILGAGNIGDNNLTLNNQGTIMASGSAGLTVNPLGTQTASSPGLTNTGTLESSAGSTLALVDGLVQNSSGAANGTIQTNNGVVQITTSTVNGGAVAVNGGSLQLSSSTVTPSETVAMTGVSSLFLNNNSTLNAAVSNSGTGVIETSTGGFFANTISGNVTNPAGGQVIVGNNTGLVVTGSTVTNTGTIELNSIGNTTELEFGGTTTTLTGGGTVTLSNTTANFIFGTGASTLVNANNTILGAGNLGDNNLTLNNQGTIMASGSAGLTVNPLGTQTASSPGLTNTGTLESSLGSTLALVDGLVQNSSGATNGTIQTNNGVLQITTSTVNEGTVAVNGGSLQLSSSTVTPAGTVAMTGVSSLFLNNNSTLNAAVSNSVNGLIETSAGGFFANTISGNVTNPAGGQVIVGNNTGLVLSGSTVTNTGSITLASIGNTTELEFGATNATLTGGGSVTLTNTSANFLFGTGTNTLTNQNNTISGGGTIKSLGIVNNGTILANTSTPLIILPTTAGINNQGTLSVGSGSLMEIGTSRGGALLNFSGTTLTGGTYNVSGTLEFGAKGTSVVTNAANINLTGPFAQIIDFSGENILAGLASNATGSTFALAPGANFTTAGNFTNNGTLTVGAGSTFDVTGNLTNFAGTTLTGGVYNLTGTLEFTGANIVTNAASITLTGSAAGIISQTGASGLANFASNASSGKFTLSGGANFTTAGNFTNSGTLTAGSGSKFDVNGNLTNFSGTKLTGGVYAITGTLQFNNANIVTNAANITLTGPSAEIVNQTGSNALGGLGSNNSTGKFTVTGGQALSDSASAFSNAGTLTVGKSSQLKLTGASATYTQTAGSTTVDGTLTASGGETVSGGSVFGNGGTWSGDFNNSGGTFNVGDKTLTAGSESITGTYTQGSGGALDIDGGGTTAGTQFDQLTVSGAASLNGTLNLDLINNFVPTIGSMFDILNASSVTGTFATVNGTGINSGEHFTVVFNSNNVTLDVVAGTGPLALRLATNSPTPEPASLLLLATGLGAAALSRRRLKRGDVPL